MGAKRPLNGTSKVNTQTDRQTNRKTDRQTNIWTFRLIESIGPEGRCFENWVIICHIVKIKFGRSKCVFAVYCVNQCQNCGWILKGLRINSPRPVLPEINFSNVATERESAGQSFSDELTFMPLGSEVQ